MNIYSYPSELRETVKRLENEGWSQQLIDKYVGYYRKRMKKVSKGRVANKDSSMTKLYRAEWDFQRKHGLGRKFETIEEAQKYADKIVNSKTWQKIGREGDIIPRRKVDVVIGKFKGRTAGRSWGRKIELCKTHGMNEYVLIHELAHSAGFMHHDISFRQALLALVSRFMGRETAKNLKAAMRARGLQLTVRGTVKTPEQWLESYNKLATARASRVQ